MKKRLIGIAAATLLTLGVTPAAARADVIFSPFLGLSFGGDARKEAVTYGGTLTFMGGGVFGFELDAALSPDMLSSDNDLNLDLGSNSVGTVMANFIIGAPLGKLRPYASAGGGLLRINIEDPLDLFDADRNTWGVNVGAGVMGFFSEHVGMRADVRYFRRIKDDDTSSGVDLDLGQFNFWRGTVGLSLRF
jgi:opacity protein-like surface antigen